MYIYTDTYLYITCTHTYKYKNTQTYMQIVLLAQSPALNDSASFPKCSLYFKKIVAKFESPLKQAETTRSLQTTFVEALEKSKITQMLKQEKALKRQDFMVFLLNIHTLHQHGARVGPEQVAAHFPFPLFNWRKHSRSSLHATCPTKNSKGSLQVEMKGCSQAKDLQ